MQIRWLEFAVSDLDGLYEYIAENNPAAAKDVAKRILRSVKYLNLQPGIGRPGRISGTRELVIPGTPYIIPYRIKNNIIEILRVLHGAMQWPDNF